MDTDVAGDVSHLRKSDDREEIRSPLRSDTFPRGNRRDPARSTGRRVLRHRRFVILRRLGCASGVAAAKRGALATAPAPLARGN